MQRVAALEAIGQVAADEVSSANREMHTHRSYSDSSAASMASTRSAYSKEAS